MQLQPSFDSGRVPRFRLTSESPLVQKVRPVPKFVDPDWGDALMHNEVQIYTQLTARPRSRRIQTYHVVRHLRHTVLLSMVLI